MSDHEHIAIVQDRFSGVLPYHSNTNSGFVDLLATIQVLVEQGLCSLGAVVLGHVAAPVETLEVAVHGEHAIQKPAHVDSLALFFVNYNYSA